jgi:tape measure domain-containing protein
MANNTLATTLKIVDNMTAPIASIQSAVSMLETRFNALAKSADIDTGTLNAMKNQLALASSAARVTGDNMQLVADNISGATVKQHSFNAAVSQGSGGVGGLAGKIGGLIAAYASVRTVGKVIGLSDEMASTAARLNLMNDGLRTAEELQQMIYQSAQRSRGEYAATANTVARLGLLAGSAFENNQEVVAFAEQMNKQFAIGGATVSEQTNAMHQLTQAMAAGRLQGDEFRSIMENAPMLAQAIADNMGKTTGELKEMSSEGLITADVIKNALFSAAEQTNAKFAELPRTWAQNWTAMKNTALFALAPLLEYINELANDPRIQAAIAGIGELISTVAALAVQGIQWVLSAASAIYNFIQANLRPILIALTVVLAILAAQAIATGIAAFVSFLAATWPLLLIIAIITAVILGVRKLGVSFEDIFGYIGRVVGSVIAGIVNVFIDLWNFLAEFINSFARMFDDPVAGIMCLFVSLFTFVLDVVSNVAKIFDTLFGSKMSEAISGWSDHLREGLVRDYGATEEIAATIKHVNADDWIAAGGGIGAKFGAFLENPDISGLLPQGLTGAGEEFDYLGTIADNTAMTAANTGKSNEFSEEELKLWRDIAERDVVNRFTTAEVSVDFGGITQNVASGMDLDGIVDYIGERLEETLFEVAEGVHA